MSIEIEIFINKVSIKIYKFSITNTIKDIRQKLGIGNSEEYIFLINDKEIKFSEEEQYTIKNFKNNKKIYIKKQFKENPFLLNNKNKNDIQYNNKYSGIKEVIQNKKIDIKEEIKGKKTEESKKEPNKVEELIKENNEKEGDEAYDISENIYETENIDYEIIDNKVEQGTGIEQLTTEDKNEVKIRKDLLKTVNAFVACLGPPGSGKSTFCSNYYKILYKVKNDFFESSDEDQSFTKGIWIVSDAERRKIPIMIKKDLLDVEGFQADAAKCWKYVMIIAFLSTE